MLKKLMLVMPLLTLNIYSSTFDSKQVVNVANYPSNITHHVSGTVLNIYRFATPEEKQLAAKKAELELISLQKPALPFFQQIGDAVAVNYNYLVEAKPFGIPYGFPIAASAILAYACYQEYKKRNQ